MYRSFADVVTKNDLDEHAKQAGTKPLTPPVEGGKPHNHIVPRSDGQSAYMEKIIDRMENLPKDPHIVLLQHSEKVTLGKWWDIC